MPSAERIVVAGTCLAAVPNVGWPQGTGDKAFVVRMAEGLTGGISMPERP